MLRRIVLPQAFRTVIPPLGLDHDRDDQELGDRRRLAAGAAGHAQGGADRQLATRSRRTRRSSGRAVGYLLLTVTATVVFRDAGGALAIAAMGYLFNPDNWEWLWTGNNARFLLEGFLDQPRDRG